MSLKLGPIPERAPIKLNISLALLVHEALADYAARISARPAFQRVFARG